MEAKSNFASPQNSPGRPPFRSDELEFATLQLLLTAQNNVVSQIEKPSEFLHEMDAQRGLLVSRATFSNPSALSRAFCAALDRDNVYQSLETIYTTFKITDDYAQFKLAYDEISTQILQAFTESPHDPKINERRKTLFSYAKQTENNTVKFLIAARLETLGAIDLAVILYAYLLTKNYSPPTQLANLIRIGKDSPEAFYQIGKHIIIRTFTDDKFRAPLIEFTKQAIIYLLPDTLTPEVQSIFSTFTSGKNQSLTEIALTCIQLAVYNKAATHAQAARFFSQRAVEGVPNHLAKSPQVACEILEYAYRRSAAKERELLLKQLIEFGKPTSTLSKDPWVNTMLANFYTLSLTAGSAKNLNALEVAQKAYEHYQRVYDLISSEREGLYSQDYKLISIVRRNSYSLAATLLTLQDSNRDNIPISERLLEQAEHLLSQSGQLGYANSHCKLAILLETRADSPMPTEDAEEIDFHYRAALEAAMAKLDKKEYETILGRYREFVNRHLKMHTRLVDQYSLRLDDMRLNIEALSQYEKHQAAPTLGLFSSMFSSVANPKKEAKLRLEALSENAPLARALLWKLETRRSPQPDNLIDMLLFRGLCPNSDPNFIPKCVTLLTDYFTLATKKDNNALQLFECLKQGMLNTEQLTAETRENVLTLIEFYVNIINNKLEACRKPASTFPAGCRAIFFTLEQRVLLKPETYRTLRDFFDPIQNTPAKPQKGSLGESFTKVRRTPPRLIGSLLMDQASPRGRSIGSNNRTSEGETAAGSAPPAVPHGFPRSRHRANTKLSKHEAQASKTPLLRSNSAPSLIEMKKKTASAPPILQSPDASPPPTGDDNYLDLGPTVKVY